MKLYKITYNGTMTQIFVAVTKTAYDKYIEQFILLVSSNIDSIDPIPFA